jgi:prepilin-type N-terminal cleavage/methylation domain-containing protein
MFWKGFTLIELMIVLVIVAVITAIALPNQIRSREAANETAAIASCHAIATAQNIYRRTDYNHDGVLEYAQHIKGDNSLFETTAGLEDIVLVDRGLANAEGDPQTTATAKAGYVFKVLTGQGATATGGAYSYVDANGHMTLGYAVSAVPDQYDGTGRNAFLLSAEGAIYQNDRGAGNTGHEPNYDPDSTWVISE